MLWVASHGLRLMGVSHIALPSGPRCWIVRESHLIVVFYSFHCVLQFLDSLWLCTHRTRNWNLTELEITPHQKDHSSVSWRRCVTLWFSSSSSGSVLSWFMTRFSRLFPGVYTNSYYRVCLKFLLDPATNLFVLFILGSSLLIPLFFEGNFFKNKKSRLFVQKVDKSWLFWNSTVIRVHSQS